MKPSRLLAPFVLAAITTAAGCSAEGVSNVTESESAAVTQEDIDYAMRTYLDAMCARFRTLPGVACTVDADLSKVSLQLAVGDEMIGEVRIPSNIEIAPGALLHATNKWAKLGYPVPVFKIPQPKYDPRDPAMDEVPPLAIGAGTLRTMAAGSNDEFKQFLIKLFDLLAKADLKGLADKGKLLEADDLGIASGSGTVNPATTNEQVVSEYKTNASQLADLGIAKSLLGVTDAAVGLTLGLVVLSGGTGLLVGATVFCAYTFPKFLAAESISNRATALGQRQVTLTREMQRRGVPVPGAPAAGGGGGGGSPSGGGGGGGPIIGGGGSASGGSEPDEGGGSGGGGEGGGGSGNCEFVTIDVWGVPRLYIQCTYG